MTITLPDELRAELEQGAKAEGLASPDQYVHVMYQRAKHHGRVLDDLADLPADQLVEVKRRLKELVQEGLNSGPAVPVTGEFWESLRQTAERKAAASGAVG